MTFIKALLWNAQYHFKGYIFGFNSSPSESVWQRHKSLELWSSSLVASFVISWECQYPLDHYTSRYMDNMLRKISHKSPFEINFRQVTFLNSYSTGDPVIHNISNTARIASRTFSVFRWKWTDSDVLREAKNKPLCVCVGRTNYQSCALTAGQRSERAQTPLLRCSAEMLCTDSGTEHILC